MHIHYKNLWHGFNGRRSSSYYYVGIYGATKNRMPTAYTPMAGVRNIRHTQIFGRIAPGARPELRYAKKPSSLLRRLIPDATSLHPCEACRLNPHNKTDYYSSR